METSGSPGFGEELVRLASADNFRDVTGPDAAYVAADGTPLRRGVAYRSNELQLVADDVRTLHGLRIAAILDLRSGHEVETHPDAVVPGASWNHLEVKGIPMEAVDRPARPGDGARGDAAGLPRLRDRGAECAGGVRASCSAASPSRTRAARRSSTAPPARTGPAGRPRCCCTSPASTTRPILEDYLLTNTFSSATREKYLGLVREHLGEDKVDGLRAGDGRRRGVPPGRVRRGRRRRTATARATCATGSAWTTACWSRLRDRMRT